MVSGAGTCREIMDHVGWFTKGSYDRYTRINKMVGSDSVSSVFKTVASDKNSMINHIFDEFGDSSVFPQAFL